MEKKGRFSPSTAWRWDEAPPRATQGGRGPPGPRSSGWAGPTSGQGRADAFAGEKAPGGSRAEAPVLRAAQAELPGPGGRHRPLLRAFFSTSTMPEVSPTVTVHVLLIWDCSNPAA